MCELDSASLGQGAMVGLCEYDETSGLIKAKTVFKSQAPIII
jgi:hypothetical protein